MRFQTIAALALVIGCIMAAEEANTYEIDNALQALIDLRDDSKDNLFELEESWRQVSDSLHLQESNLWGLIANKKDQCSGADAARQKTQDDLQQTNDYIDWLQKQIQEKKDKLQDLLTRRCELNKQFIDQIKREKVSMSLLEFIRLAIQNKDNFDFVQMKRFNKNFASFLQAYQRNDINALILIQGDLVDRDQFDVDVDFSTSDRTEQEIGTGHIDNNKGDIDLEDFTNGRRRNWQAYKAELLQILSDLKQTIADKIKKSIDDEIAASVALANYKNNTLREVARYENDLEEQGDIKIQLEAQLIADTNNASQCQSDLSDLEHQLQSIEDEIESKTNEFTNKQTSIGEEIQLFDEVIALYESSIYTTDEDFKARQDDYIDDGNFDNAEYDDREVPKIDFIGDEDHLF